MQRANYPSADLDAAGMNWTALVYGGPMLLILIWWFVSARKWFKGPKVNLEHMMFGREEMLKVQGQEVEVAGDDESERDKKTGLVGYE